MKAVSMVKHLATLLFLLAPPLLCANNAFSGSYNCQTFDSTIDDPEEQYYESILKFSVVDDNRSEWTWKTGEGDDEETFKGTGLVTQGTIGSLFKNGDDTYGVLFYTTDDAGETLHGEWLYMGNDDVEDLIEVDECTWIE